MKQAIILFLLLSVSFPLVSQSDNCDCSSDLEFLHSKIKKSAPYKKNKEAYQMALAEARKKANKTLSKFECLELLNMLVVSLNDWHIGVVEKQVDSLALSQDWALKYDGDISSLSTSMADKPLGAVEGIYHVADKISLALVYDSTHQYFEAVVLQTDFDGWKTGDIVFRYHPLSDGFYKCVGAQFPGKRLVGYIDRINKGHILRSGFKKDTSAQTFTKSPYKDQKYVYEDLSAEIAYLKIGSFSSYNPTLSEAEAFYKTLDGRLTTKHLILDLRDNGGGGDRNSDILYKKLKHFLKKGRIYVITNASTGSNAEQFAIKLKKHESVVSFGDKTKGSLAYEIGTKDYHNLNACGFQVILTSKLHKEFLPYETKGVQPDHYLDYNRSWIDQVKEFIEAQ